MKVTHYHNFVTLRLRVEDFMMKPDSTNGEEPSNQVEVNMLLSFINQGDILSQSEINEVFIDFQKRIRNIDSVMRKRHASLKLSMSKFFIERMGG